MKGIVFIAVLVLAVAVEGGLFRREAHNFDKKKFHEFLAKYICKVHGKEFDPCKKCVDDSIASVAEEGDKEAEEAGCKWRDRIETFSKAITKNCAAEFKKQKEVEECADKEDCAKCLHEVLKADHCEYKSDKVCTENTATEVEPCKTCINQRCLDIFKRINEFFEENKEFDEKKHEEFKKMLKSEVDKNVETCGPHFKKHEEMKKCTEQEGFKETMKCVVELEKEFQYCNADSAEQEDPNTNDV